MPRAAAAVAGSGCHPVTMSQPTQMPASSDGSARRVTIARPIASAGGRSESHPNGFRSTQGPSYQPAFGAGGGRRLPGTRRADSVE